MKRNILKATLVAAVALVASVTVYNAQKPDMEMSDAALANVEALAQSEPGGSGFEVDGAYPYVTRCNVVISSNGLWTKRCKVDVIVCQGGGSGCNSKKCPVHPA